IINQYMLKSSLYTDLDISQQLARHIYSTNKPDNVLHLITLGSSLSILSKIYPIDCMIDLPDLRRVVGYSEPHDLEDINYINACQSNSRGEIIKGNCVVIPDYLLHESGTLEEIKVYNTQSTNLLQTNDNVPLTRFVEILKCLAEVFQLKMITIQVKSLLIGTKNCISIFKRTSNCMKMSV
ncbi:5724_t:CDS:2, partial [Funneliformis caledonium]